MAKISSALETFIDKNCIKGKIIAMKITKYSNVKIPKMEIIIKNHRVKPAETVSALNFGDDNSMLNRIDERH